MKQIRTVHDLAVRGAVPAFNEPLHVGRPNLATRDDFMRLTQEIYERRWLTNNGPLVQEFESAVCRRLGVRHCVAMCNGTVALEIAIRALGLTGEVILPSWTFVASAHALHWQALTPVFADIDPSTHNIDPDAVRRLITPRTSGILGVHLWGRPAPVDDLQSIADEFGLQLLFDAAHAFDCSLGARTVGTFGRCEVLSFHATKVLNSMEGGAVVTQDSELADAMRLMRNFGFRGYDDVAYPGTNGKMVEVCAAMGLVNLASLDEFVTCNRQNYEAYSDAFSNLSGASVLKFSPADRSNFHYVVVELDDEFAHKRDEIVSALHAENVLARRYFWPGCHKMSPYRELQPSASRWLERTEAVSRKVVVLPTGPSVSLSDIEIISDVVRVVLTES